MPKIRWGKTEKDHQSGAWGNRFENRRQREAWQKDNRATNASFPKTACNGKKNRHRWTGKGNTTIVK